MPYKDKDKQREYQRERCAKCRAAAIKRRGGKCVKCGSMEALEFHHRNRKTKKSHKVWSWEAARREAELNKCDLLCAECHKLETAEERGYGTAPHGTITAYKTYGCRCKVCRSANAKYEHGRRLQVHT